MRVAVIGAGGRTGRRAVSVLQRRGHDVVAVVRTAAKAPPAAEPRVADARDPVALAVAVAGADAVVSCVGPVRGESRTVMAESMRALLEAMQQTGIRRLVVVTASGWVVDGDDPLSRFVAKPLLGVMLREANADLGETERSVRAGDRDWTIVRPPRLLDRPGTGGYRSRRDGNVRWRYSIRRDDLALALADVLEDPTTIGHVVSVAN